MMLLAIDPGPVESAWCVYDTVKQRPLAWAKAANAIVREVVAGDATLRSREDRAWVSPNALAIEMVASYGMAVGAEIFDTVVWVGRFTELWLGDGQLLPRLVYRREVKLHLCGSMRAKDANVRQALIDRFGPGKDVAIGRKASPGPLYGMAGDCWAALSVAITAAETESKVSTEALAA